MSTLYRYRKRNVQGEKQKLETLFREYAEQGSLNKEKLTNAFQYLGAQLPKMQADEALSVAGKNNSNFISTDREELQYLVEYAYNKGFRVSDF